MKATDIFRAAPGDVVLLCCDEERVEDMVFTLQNTLPQPIRDRAALNASPVLAMELCRDEAPDSFRDLAAMCGKLILAAGRRSHFEGLLLLDVSSLLGEPFDPDPLRALGEVLAMEGGLASRCVTVLYGPTREGELLLLADLLDFDGRLRADWFEAPDRVVSLKTQLQSAGLSYSSPKAAKLLETVLTDMQNAPRFSPLRFLQSCAGPDKAITEKSARAAIDDPYSYLNRQKKLEEILRRHGQRQGRRIGFHLDDEA